MTDNVNVEVSNTDEASYDHLRHFVEKVEGLVANEDYVAAGPFGSRLLLGKKQQCKTNGSGTSDAT
ncbi:hypothetical protein QT23_00380 [Staphylococcus aureus]|nr:hypothetical protein QT23_00380 [Staphylococcus aureus]